MQVALERALHRSTMLSYRRLLDGLGVLDSDPSKEKVLERIWAVENAKRSTVIAVRSVFGWDIKISRAVPGRYDLPSEDTLRARSHDHAA